MMTVEWTGSKLAAHPESDLFLIFYPWESLVFFSGINQVYHQVKAGRARHAYRDTPG